MIEIFDPPFVSIIIPTLNAALTVEASIEAVLNQTYPKERMEIIVIDGGSIDDTVKILSEFPLLILLQTQDYPGDSGARNIGALYAQGEIIVTTDADDTVDPNWLINLIRQYTEPYIGSVVGSSRTVYDKSNWQERLISLFLICVRGSDRVEDIYNKKGMLKTNIGVGPNQSFRKSVFKEIGGYDMGLTSGMDLDIVWRVEKAGYKCVFAPNSIVYKKSRKNFRDFIRQTYDRSKGGTSIYLKHPSKITPIYICNMLFIDLVGLLVLMNIDQTSKILAYSLLMVLLVPLGFTGIKLMRTRKYITGWIDRFLLFLVVYIVTIVSSVAFHIGVYNYIFKYKESLITP